MTRREDIIQTVRAAITRGEVQTALQILSEYFVEEGAVYRQLQRTAMQLQAQAGRLRQDKQRGLLSAAEEDLAYNQLTDRLLSLADDLAKAPGPRRMVMQRRTPWIIIGIMLLGGLIFALWPREEPTPLPPQPPDHCPDFSPAGDFNILILKFQPLSEGPPKYVQRAVRNELGTFADRYDIEARIAVLSSVDSLGLAYPASAGGAEHIGQQCVADLVIWGNYEVDALGQTIVTMRYVFVNIGDRFPLIKLATTDATTVDTVHTISSIATEGLLTQDIKTNIQLLFGMIATQLEQHDAAIGTFKELEADIDTALAVTWGKMLAQNYVATGKLDSAEQVYTTLLAYQPDDVLALNNRGMLRFARQDYERAGMDLDKVVQMTTADPGLLAALGTSYLETGRLAKAATVLSNASHLLPEDRLVIQKLEQVHIAQRAEEARKVDATQKLQRNPGDRKALRDYAHSQLKLGDSEAAQRAGERIIRDNPRNAEGYEITIRAELEQDQPERATALARKAVRNGIPKDTLLRRVPSLEEYFDPPPQRRSGGKRR